MIFHFKKALEKTGVLKLYTCKNFMLAMSLLACMLLPDSLINMIMGSSRIFWNWISFSVLALFCYGLNFLKKKPFLALWWCLCGLETVQFTHIVYFGVPLFPSAVMAIFSEYRDIFDPAYFQHVWFVMPVLLITYGAGTVAFIKLSSVKKNSAVFSSLIIVYALSLMASDGLTARPFRLVSVIRNQPHWLQHRCLIRTPSPSVRSTIFTLSCTAARLFSSEPQHTYEPYKLMPLPSTAKNIVLIMGESFAASHMSLFGYPRKTTQHIEALSQDPHFVFTRSYSAAPSTKTSLMLFFNAVREPGNREPVERGHTNLFRRAKANGFKTFLITNNDGSRGIGPDIDDVRSSLILDSYPHATFPKALISLKDKAFPEILAALPLAEKNFIVLHMRAPHSPFATNYEKERERFSIYPEDKVISREKPIDGYDNTLVYLDTIFHEIIESFKTLFKGRGDSYLLFTADHGELFGEKDSSTGAELSGHGHLTLSCVDVPFWIYSLRPPNQPIYDKVRLTSRLSAYEVGEILLNLVGDKLVNPNLERNIFYVSESLLKKDISHYIAYQRTPQGEIKILGKK